jgi:signal transduction histidine kinase
MTFIRRSRTDAGARRSGVVSFVVSGLVATIAVALIGVAVIQRTGRSEAIRDAKELSSFAGEGIVAPVLSDGVLKGRPAALAELDRVVRRHVLKGSIVRVKIWSPEGRIVYSDSPELIGKTYPLGEDEAKILRHGGVAAEVSDLSKPENRLDRHWDKLLEVYLPIRTRAGSPVLFESYSRYTSVAASGRRVWREFAPAIIGGLLLLELVQVPLAVRLSRRLRQGQLDREALLRRAIQASDLERRRIARDLHDGAVQDLAGISFSLAAAALATDDPEAVGPLTEGADSARRSMRELRSLLVEIYPPDLQRAGLAAALSDTLALCPAHGVAASLELPEGLDIPPAVEGLLFRVAQEALRNVLAHAQATLVEVAAGRDGGNAWLSVRDDGRGFDPGVASEQSFGLRLLRDLVEDAGGRFEVTSAPGAGSFLLVEVPAQ